MVDFLDATVIDPADTARSSDRQRGMYIAWLSQDRDARDRVIRELDLNIREQAVSARERELEERGKSLEEKARSIQKRVMVFEERTKFREAAARQASLAKGVTDDWAEGVAEGLDQGWADGGLRAQQNMARRAFELGFDPEMVASLTGLALEDVRSLA